MPNQGQEKANAGSIDSNLRCLSLLDISVIDEALHSVGVFGEVHLVVENGRLKFVRTVKSEKLNAAHLRLLTKTEPQSPERP